MTGTPATQSNNFDFTFTAKTNKEPIGEIDSMDDFIIEQYTGLKDKNGVGIYEGDILKDRFNNLAVILWDSGDAGYLLNDVSEYIRGCFDEPAYILDDSNGWVVLEVIGNIHENPELLAPPPAKEEHSNAA